MKTSTLRDLVINSLEEMKAQEVRVIDVRDKSSVTDIMVIAGANSDRHVRSLAQYVVEQAKQAEVQPYGVEGERDGEWVLVDLGDVVVHVMLPRVRDFYDLEKLWSLDVLAATAVDAQH